MCASAGQRSAHVAAAEWPQPQPVVCLPSPPLAARRPPARGQPSSPPTAARTASTQRSSSCLLLTSCRLGCAPFAATGWPAAAASVLNTASVPNLPAWHALVCLPDRWLAGPVLESVHAWHSRSPQSRLPAYPPFDRCPHTHPPLSTMWCCSTTAAPPASARRLSRWTGCTTAVIY